MSLKDRVVATLADVIERSQIEVVTRIDSRAMKWNVFTISCRFDGIDLIGIAQGDSRDLATPILGYVVWLGPDDYRVLRTDGTVRVTHMDFESAIQLLLDRDN